MFRNAVFFIAFFFCTLCACLNQSVASVPIIVDGSTTVLPIMQISAERYMQSRPNINISISGGGSGNGIKSLLDGLADIAMSSRDMTAVELEKANEKGVYPVKTVLALDALVPVAHPENPVQDLSMAQLRDIYAGRLVNWKEVGGPDAKIVVISRDSSSGTYKGWSELVMKNEKIKPGALLQVSSGMVVQIVSGNRKAIGYLSFGYLNKYVKKLDIGGIEASRDSILSGKWPILHYLYLFTNGEPTGEIAEFISYLIGPHRGQRIVEELGFVPVHREEAK